MQFTVSLPQKARAGHEPCPGGACGGHERMKCMKIKFIKPLPRIDHVIPAGQTIDCPEGFARKMIRTGRAVLAGEEEGLHGELQTEEQAQAGKVPEMAEEPAHPFLDMEDDDENPEDASASGGESTSDAEGPEGQDAAGASPASTLPGKRAAVRARKNPHSSGDKA